MIFHVLMMLFACFIGLSQGQTVSWDQDPYFKVEHYNVLVSRLCNRFCPLNGFVVPHSFGGNTRISLGITSLNFKQSSASLGVQLAAYTLTSTQYNFLVNIQNQTTLYSLNIDVLTSDVYVYDYYMGYGAFYCKFLNQGQGYRSQNYTIAVGSPFNFDGGGISAAVYPLGFNVFNPNGSYFYLNWKTYINRTHYTIVFQTNDKNLVSFINFQLISFDAIYTRSNRFVRYVSVGVITCPGVYCMGTGGYIPGPVFDDQNQQFWGMSGFNFTKNQQIDWYLNTTSYADLSVGYIQSVGINQIRISGIIVAFRRCLDFDSDNTTDEYFDPSTLQCVLTCITAPYVYAQVTDYICVKCHYTCLTCNSPAANSCLSCNSVMRRSPSGVGVFSCYCNGGSVEVGVEQCKLCSSSIPGCATCATWAYCYTCNAGLQVKTNHAGCECIDPSKFLTRSGQCIDIKACLSYSTAANGTLLCIECDIKNNFVLSQFKCKCNSGFQEYYFSNNNTYTCVQTCGNGKLTQSQLCDDGNIIEGDGCNSLCVIEWEYRCFAEYAQTSFCLRSNTTLKYYGSLKDVDSQNSVQIYFSLSPANYKFIINQNLIINSLYSSLKNNNKFSGLAVNSYLEGQQLRIIFLARYLQKVDTVYQHFMSFQMSDSIQLDHFKTSVNFKIQSKNYPLYLQSSNSFNVYSYIVLIVIVIGYLLAFISIFTQNWIGIELIQFFQLIFFYCFLFNKIDGELQLFINFLKFSTGYNRIESSLSIYQYYHLQNKLFTLGYSQQFILNFNCSALLFCIPIILLIIKYVGPLLYKLFGSKKKKTSKKNKSLSLNSNPEFNTLDKILSLQFIVGKVTLFLVFIFLFPIIFSFSMNLTNPNPDDYNLTSMPIQIFIFGLLLVQLGIIGWLYIQSWQLSMFYRHFKHLTLLTIFSFKRFKPSYPLIYTTFQLVKFVVLILISTSNTTISQALYLMISLQSFYFLFSVFYRPYTKQRDQQKPYCYLLHNLHNYWNLLGLIGFLIIILKCNEQNNQNIQRFNIVIVTVILTIFILSVIFTFLRLFLSKRLAAIQFISKPTTLKQNQLINKYKDEIKRMNMQNSNTIFKSNKKNKPDKQTLKKQLKTMKKHIFSKVGSRQRRSKSNNKQSLNLVIKNSLQK